MTNQELHTRNLVVANELRKREAELLPLLMDSYQRKLFRELGYTGIWINNAKTMKQHELEKAVSNENPKAIIRERIRPVAKERLELRTGISEKFDQKLQRVKDLAQTSSIEEALEACLDAHLEKHDPVKKAERARKRKQKPAAKASSGRRKLPAQVVHEVVQRDGEQCTHRYSDGSRCTSRRFLEKHHLQPVAFRGLNSSENLVTLCRPIIALAMLG